MLTVVQVRVLGSPIAPDKSALAPVYVSLVPAALLQDPSVGPTAKFGSWCTPFGREYIGVDSVPDQEEKAQLAQDLLRHCENLSHVHEGTRRHCFRITKRQWDCNDGLCMLMSSYMLLET